MNCLIAAIANLLGHTHAKRVAYSICSFLIIELLVTHLTASLLELGRPETVDSHSLDNLDVDLLGSTIRQGDRRQRRDLLLSVVLRQI